MPKNDCESATEAVRNDLKRSEKSFKQIGSELRRDLPVSTAYQKIINKLNPESTENFLADEAVSVCLIAEQGFYYINYIFNNLNGILKQQEASDFLKTVLDAYMKKLSQEEAEKIVNDLCENLGYLKPKKINEKYLKDEKEKICLIKELQQEVLEISKKVLKMELKENSNKKIEILNMG